MKAYYLKLAIPVLIVAPDIHIKISSTISKINPILARRRNVLIKIP